MKTLYKVIYQKPQRTQFVRASKAKVAPGDTVMIRGEHVAGKVVWKGKADEDCENIEMKDATLGEGIHTTDYIRDIRQKEQDALQVFGEKIIKHGLPMVPIDAEWEPDNSRLTLFFAADKRVDFRALVRDLARIYRRRIELRQINQRKVSQRLGGCGACGRELCCASFLHEMPSVSVKDVEELVGSQNLSKLVGACGQLKCCLRYENTNKDQNRCGGCKSQNLMAIDAGTG